MIVVRFRSESDMKDTLKKLKRMHRFTKELINCFEEKLEDDDFDDEEYRDDDDKEYHAEKYSRRYRRNM